MAAFGVTSYISRSKIQMERIFIRSQRLPCSALIESRKIDHAAPSNVRRAERYVTQPNDVLGSWYPPGYFGNSN